MEINMPVTACLLSLACSVAAADNPQLAATKLYNGVNRPVTIEISNVTPENQTSLVLMDAFGEVLVDPLPVELGAIDLAERMPEIWRIRRACFLQLLNGSEPVGSALVLQPMLSRPPIWVRRDTRPDGSHYSRIVGWGDKPPEGWTTDVEAAEDAPGEPAPDEQDAGDDAPEIEPRVFSGLRIYPEQDVILESSKGEMRFAMSPEEAPNTVWNFLRLVEGGFYTDIIFHRIVPLDRNGNPFVIQAGDPSETGSGGPGYWLPIEPSTLPHDFGVISMARADDPDSAGGQLFICLSREGTARLDGQYCAFGYAIEGATVIRDIADVKLADVRGGRPAVPPRIEQARLVPAPPRIPGRGRPDQKVSVAEIEERRKPDRVDR